MNLSDSLTVGHLTMSFADTMSRGELVDAWALIATEAAEVAALRAAPEQIRSLGELGRLLGAERDPEVWESLLAATYAGLIESSGNDVLDVVAYELWNALTRHVDMAAALWPIREGMHERLEAVIDRIAASDPDSAVAGMVALVSATRGAVANSAVDVA